MFSAKLIRFLIEANLIGSRGCGGCNPWEGVGCYILEKWQEFCCFNVFLCAPLDTPLNPPLHHIIATCLASCDYTSQFVTTWLVDHKFLSMRPVYVTVFWKTDHLRTRTEIHVLPVHDRHTRALSRNTKHWTIDSQVCFYKWLFIDAVKP